MSGIGEGLAEAGQGIAVAAAIEGVGGGSGTGGVGDGHTHESACLNCRTRLVGSHCHACGQAAHVHRTLGAFFHDLLHGVFHFEGKIWRTLPLLVARPGRLTREYIDGRRASYVSPLALFLFCVFLMFAVFHAIEGTEGEEKPGTSANVESIDAGIARLQGDLAKLRAERTAANKAGRSSQAIEEQIDGKQDALDSLRDIKTDLPGIATGAGRAERSASSKISSSFPRIQKAIEKYKANPDLAAYKLQASAYKYSWALIPISVPFVWLLFPFSRRFHLYDHAVFVTYSLCFMTLLVIGGMVAGWLNADGLAAALVMVPPVHMFLQLRGAYGLRKRSALWRTVLLLWFALSALMIFFVAIMAQMTF